MTQSTFRRLQYISPSAGDYPDRIRNFIRGDSAPMIAARGDTAILRDRLTAILCSVRCPGDIILKSLDLAGVVRDHEIPIVGGFQTPVEKECLKIMLRGTQPVVVCPARSIENMRVPHSWRKPIAEGRMLIASPFEAKRRRVTATLAEARNRFVIALSDAVIIAYAEPGGKTEQLCRTALESDKKVLTLESDSNRHLINLGVVPITPDTAAEYLE